MNLLIITTLHSFGYIIYYITSNQEVPYSPLCWIQSILLISSCQTQEVWLMIITFVCYQGITNRTFYNMQNDLYLFFGFVIFINFVYPLGLILIYYCADALGPFETYCWVKNGLKSYMVILYVFKFLYIILNLLMTIRLLFKVNKMDKSKKENRNEITFCKKTIVFPIIQIILNVAVSICKFQPQLIYIGSFISSFDGIAYPFYIIIYTEIFKRKEEDTTIEDNIKKDIDNGKVSLLLMNDDSTENKENSEEEDKKGDISSSLDYYT